jgi:aspergillopepsin I
LPTAEQNGHAIYKPVASKKESGESWSISYGDGSGASGVVYADTVVIGMCNETWSKKITNVNIVTGPVTATSQAVEAATSVSSQFTQDTDNDGLVGLSFSSINTVSPKPATTFFDTVKSQLDSALFAADLKKGAAGSYDFGVSFFSFPFITCQPCH